MSTSYKFILLIVGILAVTAVVIVALSVSPFPQPEQQFSVMAEGRVFAKPDIAEITLGVNVENERTAEQATKKGVEQMNLVVASVQAAGVEEKDIKTVSYNLYPNYNYTESRGQQLVGWNLNQSVVVKIRALDKIGEVIAEATSAGANQAGGINFTIDDQEELKSQARAQAIDKAKAKAQELASQAGLELDDLINVYESDISYPQPYFARSEAMGMGGGAGLPAPDIQAGQNEVVVSVTLIYEVE